MNASIFLKPVFGSRRKFKITRTKYHICVVSQPIVSIESINWTLGGIVDQDFQLEISWKEDHFECCHLSGIPFKVNNIICYHAILNEGDELEMGSNRLHFRSDNEEDSNLSDDESIRLIKGLPKSMNVPVLIEGETGVGKGHLAKKIHEHYFSNGHSPFIHLNLAGLPETLLESELFGHQKGAFTGAIQGYSGALVKAHTGTLFLDEIDSLPLSIQLKLLLFLDHHKVRPLGSTVETDVDLKLIIATGQPLEKLIDEGLIRKDFFYRISSGVRINLEPLRKNPEKIKEFINSYLKKHDAAIDSSLLEFYQKFPWPGNYRQIKGHLDLKLGCARSHYLRHDNWDNLLQNMQKFSFPDDKFENIKTMNEFKQEYAKTVYGKLSQDLNLSAKALGITRYTLKSILNKAFTPP